MNKSNLFINFFKLLDVKNGMLVQNRPRKSVKNLRERERYCYIKSRHEHQSGHIFCPLLNIQVKSMKRIAIQTHRFTLSPYLSTWPLKDQSDESGDGEGGGESIHLS